MQHQAQQNAKRAEASDELMDDIFGESGNDAGRQQTNSAQSKDSNSETSSTQSVQSTSQGNKWGASTAAVADGKGVPTASEKHWACDICANINFENEVQLDAHMQTKHAGLCSQYKELRGICEEKIKPNWSDLLAVSGDRWRTWGEKTFHVAAQRDGGREKINEAHAARAQLEVIVQRWNPEAKVFVFGSSVVMGVWDGMSDIDYMVANVHDMEKGIWPPNEKNAVRALTELLKRAGFKYSNLEPVQHARVPIIKHHAAVPLYNTISKEAEDVVSRTVRWIFTQPLSTQDRIQFEAGLREAVGELQTTAAGEVAGANDSPTSHGQAKRTYQSPIVQLWWHSEHFSCSATFLTTTHAVKAIVHTPCVPATLVRRVGPLHDDFQPELYKIDFDLGFRPFGVRNSFLLRNYLNSHPCARPGAVVLKDWSKSSGINNSIGGYYTSYAVNIMWIYYLVQKGVIPYIDPLSIPQSLVDCKDFNPQYVPIFPPEIEVDAAKREAMFRQMGELLVGFYAFYCFEFDWDRHVVTLNRSGEPTLKEDLQWNDVPVVQGKKTTRYLQCIEDPYEDNLNLGRHVGDGRRWKVLQELYKGLLSLLKDPFGASCVFAVTDQSTGSVKDEDAKAADGSAPSVPMRSPTTDDMLFLTGLAVKCVESSAQGHVSETDLRAYINNESTGRGAEALAVALAAWRWDHFVRKIGYKQLGGRVYARRVVGAKVAKTAISEEAYQQASKSTSSGDLSEHLVRQSTTNALDKPAKAPPEWVLWTPPTYALPSASGSNLPSHVPGHREVVCDPIMNKYIPTETATAALVIEQRRAFSTAAAVTTMYLNRHTYISANAIGTQSVFRRFLRR